MDARDKIMMSVVRWDATAPGLNMTSVRNVQMYYSIGDLNSMAYARITFKRNVNDFKQILCKNNNKSIKLHYISSFSSISR